MSKFHIFKNEVINMVSASGSDPARVLCEALLATVREVDK
jgi:hypothetical protein